VNPARHGYGHDVRRSRSPLRERVGKLAEAAAHGADETAFAQLAALDEPAPPRGAADLRPETENLSGWDFDAVDGAQRDAQILDLAGGQRMFLDAAEAVPQWRRGACDHRCVAMRFAGYVAAQLLALGELGDRSVQAEAGRFGREYGHGHGCGNGSRRPVDHCHSGFSEPRPVTTRLNAG
jgi:hypothetical protein